ncbi:hypothetical protein C8A01DRAFT_39850 [Parachaetomium inaequale]|uniref:Uncharacterized protein n=1 Tax=Parachaetomium inaequale TaxID=2588326 RepID=A0AAN6P8H6_9PEZI|nr:hypothetical protein C8A01DRAFT_39850 [Parachaetomium inaequale]
MFRMGITLVGTISPTLYIEEAQGFFDSTLVTVGSIVVDGKGTGYKVPGIVEVNPRMDLEIQMTGSGFMDRKFQINFLIALDRPLRLSSVKADELARSDAGGLGKRDGEATPLAIRLFSRAGVDLKVFEYGNEDLIQGELAFDIAIPRTFSVRRGSDGRVTIIDEYGDIIAGAGGFYNLADATDCENPGVVSTGDQNAAGYHAEHIIEENTVPEQWSFMMTGQVRRTTMMPEFNEQQLALMPVSLMGQGSVFTQLWSQWDSGAPQGTHPNANISPEREMWDLIGSFVYPENMVNAHAAINMHKMRMVRGMMALGTNFWTTNDFDDTSQQTGLARFEEAVSLLRLYTAVFTYMNDNTVYAAMERVTQGFAAMFQRFDDRLRATGRIVQNGPRSNLLYRRYLNAVLLLRIEASSVGYFELIDRLITNWNLARSQTNPNTPLSWVLEIQGILRTLDIMLI